MTLLWLLALLATSEPPPPPELHLLAVAAGGEVSVLTAEQVAKPETLAAHHFWLWSATFAPRKVAVSELVTALAEARQPTPGTVLDAELVAKQSAPSLRGVWIAAPPQMWLEVPENLLPRWPAAKAGRTALPRSRGETWRVRFVGAGFGSWWHDVPPTRTSVRIAPQPARDLEIAIRDRRGETVASPRLTLGAGLAGFRGVDLLARFAGGERGVFTVPALPDLGTLQLLVEAPGHAPAVLSGAVSSLPSVLTLEPGTVLHGRIVDAGGAAIAASRVSLEVWASSCIPWRLELEAISDPEGKWRLEGAPAGGAAVLSAVAGGYAAAHRELELSAGELAIGELVLEKAGAVAMVVVDPDRAPIAGAEISERGETIATTDAAGRARLEGLAPSRGFEVTIDAEGFLARVLGLATLPTEAVTAVLERAWVVRGQLVDPQDRPVAEGRVTVVSGTGRRFERLAPDGSFRLDLEPGTTVELWLGSPTTREARLRLEPGLAGEVRDLGAIRAPAGLVVTGDVVRASNGSPVVGARIWALRSAEGGPLLAWMQGERSSAETDAEGRFRLEGLEPKAHRVHFEAPGLARSWRELVPQPEESLVELGRVEMNEGTSVMVRLADDEAQDAIARLDLRGEWLAPDLLEAPFVEGLAQIDHVPAGSATITVVRGQELVCEQRVVIPEAPEPFELDCAAARRVVEGQVLIGDRPAAGSLSWHLEGSQQVPGVIMNLATPGGLRQQHGLIQGRPQVHVALDERGRFSTTGLAPGTWRVLWFTADGGISEERRVELPDAEHYELRLEYPELVVRGVVVDAEGRAVEAGRVRELGTGTVAQSGADGRFELALLAPGTYQVRANSAELASEIVTVAVSAGHETEPIELVLVATAREQVEVCVVDVEQRPVAGALVFLETERGPGQILTTDLEGRAPARLEPPWPLRVRAAALAAGVWVLGEWLDWEDASAGLSLASGPVGAASIVSENATHEPIGLRSAEGWDLGWLMLRSGWRLGLEPGVPLVLSGLPEGGYTFSVGAQTRALWIEAGEITEVELR